MSRWSIRVAALVLVHALSTCTATAQPATAAARPLPSRQLGLATYYSRRFDGETTASGRPFDGDRLVAAHRQYPFGTRVRVTNVENRRNVIVTIIDRGPYGRNWREGTIIDLSPEAARRLGMLHDGQVPVRVAVLRWGNKKTAAVRP